jgi:hypothetical protein
MDIFLLILGFILMLVGILGSFLPILPGPPISWVGLLLLHSTSAIDMNWTFLGITLAIALIVFALDYVIPAIGTKKFGGTKAGVIGTTVGLIVALIFPVFGPFGIIIWPFIGALVGELLNKADKKNRYESGFWFISRFFNGHFYEVLSRHCIPRLVHFRCLATQSYIISFL